MLSLGAKLLSRPQDHDAGVNVTNACVFVYESSATGVGGERTTFYAPENPSRYEVVEGEEGEGQVCVSLFPLLPSLRRADLSISPFLSLS